MAMAGILYFVEELPYILKFDASSSLCKYRMTEWVVQELNRVQDNGTVRASQKRPFAINKLRRACVRSS